MKGFVSTLSVLLFFLVIFSLSFVFSSKIIEFSDISNRNLILDRVYNKFISTEYAIERIFEEELGLHIFSIQIIEDSFNFVIINVSLPSDAQNYKDDLVRFENFFENKTNEINLFVDLDLTKIKDCLPLTIIPYNISFSTVDQNLNCAFGSGQRDFKITPLGNPSLINEYTMRYIVNSSINPDSASFTPPKDCRDGSLRWNVTVVGNNTVYGPVVKNIQPDGKCVFRIEESVTGNKIVQVNNKPTITDTNNTLVISLQPNFFINASITLNLTDIPGKVAVGLPPQSIKVKETLYQIEKNDTVYIFGE